MLRATKRHSGPAFGTGHLPRFVHRLLDAHGGIVSTAELRAIGVDDTQLEISRAYAALQVVKQGWHCPPSMPDVIRLAWRFGGPLACISALAFADALDDGRHITADTRSGDRRAVSRQVALRQADRCDARHTAAHPAQHQP